MIQKHINKNNINSNTINISCLKNILKMLNLKKYYENVPSILYLINGNKLPFFWNI